MQIHRRERGVDGPLGLNLALELSGAASMAARLATAREAWSETAGRRPRVWHRLVECNARPLPRSVEPWRRTADFLGSTPTRPVAPKDACS